MAWWERDGRVGNRKEVFLFLSDRKSRNCHLLTQSVQLRGGLMNDGS